MADKNKTKTARQIVGYARLNFHMGMRQRKNLAVLLCMGCFLLYYLGGIRGYLASAEETVSVQELFLAMMNTHYTAMTVWVGYLLVICDIPYSEKGIYPYLIRTSRKSWLLGQILYLFLVTIFYFFYVGLVLAAAIVPHISFRISWTNAFVKMLNAPWRCGIKNYFSFTFSLIKHNSQYVVVVRQLFLCLLVSMTLGMLTMAIHMLWKNGPGILVGAVALACDYLVTAVLDAIVGLRYFSPLTLSRISALSTSVNDRFNPSFSYACLFLGGLFVVSLSISIWKLRRYEYGR